MSSSSVRRGRSFWESAVREQASSGLTQEEYSRDRGLHPSTLQRWRTRLGYTVGAAPAGGGPPVPASTSSRAVEFVRIVAETLPRSQGEGAAGGGGVAELHLPFGAMLRCAVGTDAAWLADLVVACGRASC